MTDKETNDNEDELKGAAESQKTLTGEEFFETLDRVVNADTRRDQSPDEGNSKTA